ncbi:hypothetical protein ABIA65_003202 [Mycolicibacterium sp. 624]
MNLIPIKIRQAPKLGRLPVLVYQFHAPGNWIIKGNFHAIPKYSAYRAKKSHDYKYAD